jgi:hypothetical protein
MTTKQTLAARRKQIEEADHARAVIEAIKAVDADAIRDAIDEMLPALTTAERDRLVVEWSLAIHANEKRSGKVMDVKELDEDEPRAFWKLILMVGCMAAVMFSMARRAAQ